MECLFFFYTFVFFVFLGRSFSSSSVHHLCSPTEAYALLQFKQSFQISDYFSCWDHESQRYDYPRTKSWNESRDCCTWDGVTCDLLNGHAISLDLSCSQLFGSIHPNSSLFQLHHLQTLNLSGNDFIDSSIPHNIGRLTNLRHLDLSWSSFYGKIPTEISYLSNLVSLHLYNGYELQLDERTFETMLHNFTNLEVLSLSYVNISSPIPVNISSSLRYLDLDNTNLRGVLPESIFLLPNSLETLKLSFNDLLKGVFPKIHWSSTLLELDISHTGISGELPDSIGTLSSLNILYLYGCQFSGRTPDSIGNLTQIRELWFSGNHFTGHIPSTISKLKHLTRLDLSDNSLGGAIPHVFSNHQELVSLDLSNNNFTGPFPSSILSLTSLQYLDLSHNSLNGTIHSWVFSLPSLLNLKLHHNQFSRVADEIKTNPTLVTLYLGHNQLNGPFPRSLVNLTSLAFLGFSSNNITGDVAINITFPRLSALFLSSCELKDFPHFLRNLKTLQVLDISNNKIHGRIPNWFSSMSLNILDISHNNFSNSIPNCLGSMAKLTVLDLRRNNFSGSLPLLCTQSTSLTTIALNSNQLEGSVPVSLLNCVSLKVLDLGNNAVNDTFPAWLGTLEDLQVLILKLNKFHGPITARKKFCFPRLRIFDLSHNAFNGSLPAENFRNFKAMIKNGTDKGDITYMETAVFRSFLESVSSAVIPMYKLEMAINGVYEDSVRLVIKGNDMDLERISTIDTAIDLSSNHFEGDIPKSLKDLSSLRLLNLSHNNLKGDIPMELGQLNTLEALDLSWNQLTGKIPQELTTTNFLAFLNLSQNHLVGRIPQARYILPFYVPSCHYLIHGPISARKKFCFPRLRIFDLSHNAFNGSLPAEVFRNFKAMIKYGTDKGYITYMKTPIFIRHKKVQQVEIQIINNEVYEDSVRLVIKGNDRDLERISTIDTAIDLSSNHFEGDIPKSLKDLSSLRLLNLSHNNLKGDIPMELGKLNTLEALDLSWNRLTGKIPQELTTMNFLELLNLSQNQLVGHIPQGSQFSTFENDSYGGNLDLCGPPLSKQCGTSDRSHVPQSLEDEAEEDESYFFSGFTWESVVIGYSFGLVVGTVMWSLMFNYRKPKWFVEFFDGIMPHKRRRPKKRRLRRQT
ncbi:hypothetical protein KY289_012016 [Solanum tuberosum]|nr:hypothetical protein KY289_012016 [Solanum tuberosum]